jgi:hypothetical protein
MNAPALAAGNGREDGQQVAIAQGRLHPSYQVGEMPPIQQQDQGALCDPVPQVEVLVGELLSQIYLQQVEQVLQGGGRLVGQVIGALSQSLFQSQVTLDGDLHTFRQTPKCTRNSCW